MKKRKKVLLDLFCGAGGCAVGYSRAGFAVVGVDLRPQPRYPFPFIHENALAVLQRFLMGGVGATAIDTEGRHWGKEDFAAVHASPPCQRYSSTANLPNVRKDHPDLLPGTRDLLIDLGLPWVIENVEGAPMRPPAIMLCGLSFGLKVFRHRWFESSELLLARPHEEHGSRRIGKDGMVCVAGNGGSMTMGWNDRRYVPADHRNKASWSKGMGIDWMTRDELAQAIPPAYTEFVGRQIINIIS